MCAGRSGSPSLAVRAGSAPARLRIAGRRLVPVLGRWRTTTMGAPRSAGSSPTSSLSVSTPPAEAPMTMSAAIRLQQYADGRGMARAALPARAMSPRLADRAPQDVRGDDADRVALAGLKAGH